MDKDIKRNLIITIVVFLLFYFLYSVRSILLPFVMGGIMAYFLESPTTKFEKKIKSRKIASITIITVFVLLILMFFIFIIPILLTQATELIKELANYLSKNNELISEKFTKVMAYFDVSSEVDFKKYLAGYSKNITGYFMGLLNNILSTSIAFISLLSLLIITPITTFYFLNEWNNIIKTIKIYIPKKNLKITELLFKQIDSVLSACMKGQLNVCIILGLFYGTLLFLSGLKYGFLIGLLTGLASFIPYFGMFIGFFVAMIMTFYQFGFNTTHIIITLAIFLTGQILEGNFITPKLVGSKIKLHPLWIIFSLFAGGTLFGFVGLLIALPIAGVIGVLIRFYIEQKLKYIEYEQ